MGISSLMIAGAGMSAYGQYKAGKHNQALMNFNAKIGEMRADDAIERGKSSESRHRVDVRQFIGQQRAAMGAEGVELDDGSALQVQQDSAYFGELDALTIRNNAALEAWGYKVGATNDRMQGEIDSASGRSGAAGTLLTGGANAAATYRRRNS